MDVLYRAKLNNELARQRFAMRQQRFLEAQERKKAATQPADYWEYDTDTGKHYVKTGEGTVEAAQSIIVNSGLDQDTRLEYQFDAIDHMPRFAPRRSEILELGSDREVHWARAGFKTTAPNVADLLLYTDEAGTTPIVIDEDITFTSTYNPLTVGLYYESAGSIIVEYPIYNPSTEVNWGPYLTTKKRTSVGFKVYRITGTSVTELMESPTWRKPMIEAPYHVFYADGSNFYYPYPNGAWEPEQWPDTLPKEWGFLAYGFTLNIQKNTIYRPFRTSTEMYATENNYLIVPNNDPDPAFQSLVPPTITYTELERFNFTYESADLANIFIGGGLFSSSFGFIVIE